MNIKLNDIEPLHNTLCRGCYDSVNMGELDIYEYFCDNGGDHIFSELICESCSIDFHNQGYYSQSNFYFKDENVIVYNSDEPLESEYLQDDYVWDY